MRFLLAFLILAWAAAPLRAIEIDFSPDVGTDLPGADTVLPWDVVSSDTSVPGTYALRSLSTIRPAARNDTVAAAGVLGKLLVRLASSKPPRAFPALAGLAAVSSRSRRAFLRRAPGRDRAGRTRRRLSSSRGAPAPQPGARPMTTTLSLRPPPTRRPERATGSSTRLSSVASSVRPRRSPGSSTPWSFRSTTSGASRAAPAW